MGSSNNDSHDYNGGNDRSYANKRDRKYDDRASNMHSGPSNSYSQKDLRSDLFGNGEVARTERNEGRIFFDAPSKDSAPTDGRGRDGGTIVAREVLEESKPKVNSATIDLTSGYTPAIIKLNDNPVKIKEIPKATGESKD
jgi:hypothetical protein